MNFEKILKGYYAVFSGLLTFATIAGISVLIGFIVVYPLWELATKNAALYTVISISFFGCGILFLMGKKIVTAYRKSPRRLFISLAKKITVIGGLSLAVILVFNYYKITALITVLTIFAVYGFLAFALPQEKA